MARFAVVEVERDGERVVRLRDGETGAEAQVWPGCGDNCFSLTLPRPDSTAEPVTVIQAPPALAEIRRRPSWWGIPLLFPFPGTIPQGEYEFEGRRLRLGRPGQPIVSEGKEVPGAKRDYHGFVMDLPWEERETNATDDKAVVTSGLDSRCHAEAHEGFPFPYRVEATYTLDAAGLSLDFAAINVGDGTLPFGFGAHPFFKLPLGPSGSPAECLLHVPARARWNGRALRAVLERYPDGSVPPAAWSELRPAVTPELDLREPRPFDPGTYNGMYTELELRSGVVEAFIRDAVNGLETVMRATPNFPNVVVWSPPGRDEVCFEPWICPSNVFNLAARGVPRHGLVLLEHGERWEASMWISLRPAGG